MMRVRELTLERDGFAMRDLALLLAGLIVVASVVAFVVAKGRESVPAGAIGYRNGEIERWVNTRGKPLEAPESWTPPVAPPCRSSPSWGSGSYGLRMGRRSRSSRRLMRGRGRYRA